MTSCPPPVRQYLCLYVGYASSVYCTASALTLTAIALDRYHSIMDCLRYSSRCTLWRTGAVVLWIWLQALTTCCPPLLGWGSVAYVPPMYTCAVTWASSPSYTVFMAAVSYLIPAAVILFCYVSIIKVARSHVRRIHSLADSVQRVTPSDSSHEHRGSLQGPSKLFWHVSGRFETEFGQETRRQVGAAPPDSTAEESNTSSGRLLSLLAHSSSLATLQNSQQLHNHHGVVRLFLVISAFFLCWTPYIVIALVQATETAISGRSSLVPPSAITFSYWLVLLNSDINPLLYALLSKRFRGALQGLVQRVRAQLRGVVGRGGEVRTEEENRSRDPRTLTCRDPRPPSSSETLTSDDTKCCPPIFTITDIKATSKEHLCNVYRREKASPPCSMWQAAGRDTKVDYLHVPCWPQEVSRLPFSALTKARQATFYFGQITVRVEHDVC